MTAPRKIAVIGLGIVGLFSATLFGKNNKVIAFDINSSRIQSLKDGHDPNNEVSDQELKNKNLIFTDNVNDLNVADFFIIVVPTPIDENKNPDLSMVLKASEMVAKIIKKGDIIVYESSVYPGATEEQCIPLLELISKKRCNVDFYVGYSPERINPSDTIHTIESIPKIISATNKESLEILASVYSDVIKAGVFRAANIKTAEAIKIVENIQRDINIAYMNEIAIILHKLDIDTSDVIEGMKTKWNYVPFSPGLVGGHCIGINSYYLIHLADKFNYHAPLLMASRHINEDIAKFIVQETIKELIHLKVPIHSARIGVLGLTYKENCSDVRDTKVIDIIKELERYPCTILVHDPLADPGTAKQLYNINLHQIDDLTDLDAIIITVAHQLYRDMVKEDYQKKLKSHGLIIDIKEIIDPKAFTDTNIVIWKL